ncbi:MAG: type II toxin-antitoxin system PemK/MazF family toxin [Syntrophobacteraceae bacterium]|jgi:hypothetical protein
MNRGEVWWVNFNPSVGGETRKNRPAVIVSNNASNKFRIIRDADLAESATGLVPVAARRDIIWLKRSRSSDQDRVDISELEANDEDRESS